MSARTELLDALALKLSADDFRVSTRTAEPDQIDVGVLWVMAFTNGVKPGPVIESSTLVYALELWIVSGSQDPAAVDDKLDDKLDDVLSALLSIRLVQFVEAERITTAGQQYHAYRLTLNAYATVTTD